MTPERARLVYWAETLDDENHSPFKTFCTAKVAEELNAPARYLHTLGDLIRAARRAGWVVESRTENVPPLASLRRVRRAVYRELRTEHHHLWLVRTSGKRDVGHVLLLDSLGATKVDTAPGQETHKVTDLYRIRKKGY